MQIVESAKIATKKIPLLIRNDRIFDLIYFINVIGLIYFRYIAITIMIMIMTVKINININIKSSFSRFQIGS